MPSLPPRRISGSAVRRLSLYLRALEDLEEEGQATVSSRELAERAGTTAPQVRKDLSLFGSFGKRGLGYAVLPLRSQLCEILGLSHRWRVALVGAGRIGAALFEYPHFRQRGFEIVTILDQDPRKVGTSWNGVPIRSLGELEAALREDRVQIAILAVPARAAQEVTDALAEAGIRGILNFAPVQLKVPPEVAVNNVNMAVELESLSFTLQSRTVAGWRASVERDGA